MSTTPETHPSLRLKVCGMKYADNIAEVAALEPDFMGFIFHSASSRFVGETLDARLLQSLPPGLRKVGVFVDESNEFILRQLGRYGLDAAQLHGHETPAQCAELRAAGVMVIKVFGMDADFSLDQLTPYAPYCAFFLFDTKGPQPGGNGTTFNWELLRDYILPVPYLLAGGLDLRHAPALRHLTLPGLYGLDLNSRFETAPALKDAARLSQMFRLLRAQPTSAALPTAR
ncbi:phosphoribosylanthranilate isomerase [Hymenobacter rubripertinctus]|uniref:N-(5'-phosphoribosyl)anthranilate isomerase n=1 Tax=Hymenobacter rubripertinctus TaxID=2029981 RepID=A0A418QN13_9BACT|nr:phosphoribosylanthranilate isomerase [Hymenobacter rubripertinctus]RIY06532.1 phosphoribosylanthranilate isomerase [Hymenobacter rubripertinctus]